MTDGTLRTKDGGVEIPGKLNYRESGSISFTADGVTLASFFSEKEWEFVADEPEMPDGVYVAKVWANNPEKGVKWQHTKALGWRALVLSVDGEFYPHDEHPRDFYADRPGHWWEKITLLVAESPATR